MLLPILHAAVFVLVEAGPAVVVDVVHPEAVGETGLARAVVGQYAAIVVAAPLLLAVSGLVQALKFELSCI